ncbi:MAG: ATP-grasp domain-containing protein [Planctomycetota bacterium]
MEKPRIALFGKKDDKQLLALARAVEGEGGSPLLLNIGLAEAGAPPVVLSARLASWDGHDFANIESVYVRGAAPNTLPALPPLLNPTFYSEWRTRYVREQEYQAVAYSFFELLAAGGKLVVNPLSSYVHHNSKAQFYERMRAHGIQFPRTLTTNDPARAGAFVRELRQVVVKPGIGVGSTRRLREDQLGRCEDIALAPVTMQEFVQGQTYRVHVVGDTVVLSLRILNDAVDSRTETKGFEYARLPVAAERDLVRANRLLGIHFAAWDVILADDGRAVCLDCNPGPYLMWIGQEFVRAVYGQLARYLVAYARTRSLAQASARVAPCAPLTSPSCTCSPETQRGP